MVFEVIATAIDECASAYSMVHSVIVSTNRASVEWFVKARDPVTVSLMVARQLPASNGDNSVNSGMVRLESLRSDTPSAQRFMSCFVAFATRFILGCERRRLISRAMQQIR